MELIEIGLAGIFIIVILIVLYLTMKKKKTKPVREISPMGISQIVQEEINKRGEN